jgi:hypothetical protein
MYSSCLVVITGNGLGCALFPREQVLRLTSLILDEFSGSPDCTELLQHGRFGLIVRENGRLSEVVDCGNRFVATNVYRSGTRGRQSRSNPPSFRERRFQSAG